MVRLTTTMALLLVLAAPAMADVNLSLQPVVNPVFVGSQVEIRLIATNTNPGSQLVSAIDAIIAWDETLLQLNPAVCGNGVCEPSENPGCPADCASAPYTWFVNGFLNDPDAINAPPGPMTASDGDALYTALAQPGAASAPVPDGNGLLVTTFRFTSLAATGGTPVDIVLSQGAFGITAVYDGTQGNVNILGSVSGTVIMAGFPIIDANPPADNPYLGGIQPFIDPLQTGVSQTMVTQGIGAGGTPSEGPYTYAPISVTFGGTPVPTPSPSNITVSVTGGTLPIVTSVTGAGAGPYLISLDRAIPVVQCTTLSFFATPAKLQYRSHPANVNLDAFSNTQDLLALIQALNNGDANMAANLARYNVDRMGPAGSQVNTQDLLRIIQLLNGTNTTQIFNGTVLPVCP